MEKGDGKRGGSVTHALYCSCSPTTALAYARAHALSYVISDWLSPGSWSAAYHSKPAVE